MEVSDHSYIHSNFKLNGLAFIDTDAILEYAKRYQSDCYPFLEAWFNNDNSVEVATSGATGTSKKLFIQKDHMVNSAIATGNYFDLKSGTRALLCMSPNYIAGKMMLVRALVLGWELDVVAPSSKPLSGDTGTYDFSAMVPLQVEHSLNELYKIDTLLIGGSHLPSTLREKLQDMECSVYESYGMTETVTHMAIRQVNGLAEWERQLFKVLPNVQISTDARGCLMIQAPNLSNDTVVTNDLVHIESDDSFELLGRADNLVNSGGIKLIPEQIEKKLGAVIQGDFFVAGLDDERLGQKLVLVIEGADVEDGLKEIIEELDVLNKYEKPKAIYNLPEFVRTTTGKIKRSETINLL